MKKDIITKSKNIERHEAQGCSIKRQKLDSGYESESTVSDVDVLVDKLYRDDRDLYSKWVKYIEEDRKNSLSTRINGAIREEEGQVLCKEDSKTVMDEPKEANPSDARETRKPLREIEDYYLKDYTNKGMMSLPVLENQKEDDDSSRRYTDGVVKLPGFSTYTFKDKIKTDRMYQVEKDISESNGLEFERLKLEGYALEKDFRQNWLKHANSLDKLDVKEIEKLNTFYACLNGYIDVEFSDIRNMTSPWALSLCMLHISKHVYKSRKLITDNNFKLQEALKNKSNKFELDFLGEDNMRDQGLTRCRVLILCPFKGVAREIVEILIKLLPHGKVLRGYDRFKDDFGVNDDFKEDEATGDKTNSSKENVEQEKNLIEKEIGRNDELYKYLFDGKNSEDEFKLGIQLTKSGINLYSSFDNSDIILASPLGLRMAVQNSKDSSEAELLSSFSSIELCLLYGGDVIYMQNWDHLLDVFKIMNKLPKKSLGNCDIRRVYQTHLDERSREFRQTIVISSCRIEDLNSLFRNHTYNIRGFVRLWNLVSKSSGFSEKSLVISKAQKLVRGIQQMFIKIGTSGTSEESMLDYLSSQLYPNIIAAVDGTTERVLLVLPNYVSYLRVRKYLLQQNAVFASCNESSSNSSLSRNRLAFYKGELPILVTTERFLFFRRYLIKGATKVIFGAPPTYPNIYLDCINSMNFSHGPKSKGEVRSDSISSSRPMPLAITLFHIQNTLALERIVGSSKCSNIIQNSKLFKPIIIKSPR